MSGQTGQAADEEDIDDLDDVLEQFTPSKPVAGVSSSKPKSGHTSPVQPASSFKSPASTAAPHPVTSSQLPPRDASVDLAELSTDFASELARGMESLMREITSEFPTGLDAAGDLSKNQTDARDETTQEQEAREQAFAAAWEAMLIEGMNGLVDPGLQSTPFNPTTLSTQASASGQTSDESAPEQGDFPARIRSAMNKLKESESVLHSSSTDRAGSSPTDPLEALLAKLGNLDVDEAGEGEEHLQGVLEAMMGQLMSKEVLHDPLKELNDKFPGYLSEHAATLSDKDKHRYAAQARCIQQLLAIFEDAHYNENDEATREKIVGLMGELQTYGSPPEEIMGPLPPGMNFGADGLPNMPDNCIIM